MANIICTPCDVKKCSGGGCASSFRVIPPTAVGGSFKPSLQSRAHSNFPESHPRQWVEVSGSAFGRRARSRGVCGLAGYRQHLNLPPTAVGGIARKKLTRTQRRSTDFSLSRQDDLQTEVCATASRLRRASRIRLCSVEEPLCIDWSPASTPDSDQRAASKCASSPRDRQTRRG